MPWPVANPFNRIPREFIMLHGKTALVTGSPGVDRPHPPRLHCPEAPHPGTDKEAFDKTAGVIASIGSGVKKL